MSLNPKKINCFQGHGVAVGRHLSDRRIPCCSWLSFFDFRDDGSGDVCDVHIFRSLVSPPGFWFQGKMMKNYSRTSGNLWVSPSITVLQFLLIQKKMASWKSMNIMYNSGWPLFLKGIYLKGAELSFPRDFTAGNMKTASVVRLTFQENAATAAGSLHYFERLSSCTWSGGVASSSPTNLWQFRKPIQITS